MNKNYRWIYAISGVIILVFAGLIYAWSVLSGPIAADYPEWSKGSLSLTFTLAMSFFCLGGLAAGLLSKKFNERYILTASALLLFSGFEIVSYMHSLGMLYLGFGVCAGLGAGLSYNTVMSSVTKWFPDRKGLISGILLMGFGIGAFIIGKIYAFMLAMYSWRAEYKVLGIIVFAVIFIGAFIVRKPYEDETKKLPGSEPKVIAKKAESISSGQANGAAAGSAEHGTPVAHRGDNDDFTTQEMIKTPSFWLFFFYAVFLSAAALALIAQAGGIVIEIAPSLGAGSIATIVGLISVFNGIGRVVFGGLYDRIGQKKTMSLNCALYLISILINIFAINMGNLMLVVAGFVFFGLAYGGVTPTNSAFIMDFYGVEHYPVNFSMINLNLLVASFGGTLAGTLYDVQGTYLSIFMIMMAAVAMAAVCTLLIRRPVKGLMYERKDAVFQG
ncbi:hypothetical protein BXO88_13890 [Oribacterium sp. C9]|uniref:MFS transporter n=1 Tax=Oribacterium sp. C9 TaxID=1943579 RepID=UPI00098EAF50|nr:MFS transporter [Oribacterium sp. C9]OON85152.1 hypothetical protein BXO88_13890 [Oribacterium sp. C9]